MSVIEALELLATILGGANSAIKLVKSIQASGRTTLTPAEMEQISVQLKDHPAFNPVGFLQASEP